MRRIRFFAVAISTLILSSCTDLYRDEIAELHNEIDGLKVELNQINTNIRALQMLVQALQTMDYVTSVVPLIKDGIETGYTLNFQHSGSVTILHGSNGEPGADGYTPSIGVRLYSDGKWYWTLDGEWIKDADGNMVCASGGEGLPGTDGENGITPELKIEDSYWYISYDEGVTWTRLGKATGNDGDSTILNINTDNNDYVLITLYDGTEISIPKFQPLSISFLMDDPDTSIGAGETLPLYYSIEGGSSKITVTASSDGNFKTRVEQYSDKDGVVFVTCPEVYSDGFINIIAIDGNGASSVKVVHFSERSLYIYSSLNYSLGPYGGDVNVEFNSNFKFILGFEGDAGEWISIDKKEYNEGHDVIHLKVRNNSSDNFRIGNVCVCPKNNPGTPYVKISINQASANFSIDQSGFTIPSSGDEISVHINSSRGLRAEIPDEYSSWISGSVTEEREYTYIWNLKIQRNQTGAERGAEIPIYTYDGKTQQGILVIRQLSADMDGQKNMIISVSANSINKYKVYLPLFGEVKCYVDWGDGAIDHIERNINDESGIVVHQYCSELKYYDVSIAGKVQALNSEKIPTVNAASNSIREVKQWGDIGLKSLNRAFCKCSALNKVASDNLGSFSSIKDFEGMFQECISLESIPGDLFNKATAAENFSYLFYNCSHLTIVDEQLFSACPGVTNFERAFSNCTLLNTVPENLFANNHGVINFNGIFCGSGIESIPAGIFRNNPEVVYFSCAFSGCNNLKYVPVSIFDNNRKVLDFSDTFYYSFIHNDTYGLESPYTVINGKKYHLYERYLVPDYFVVPVSSVYCFNCFYSIDEEDIPSAWK